MKACGINGVWQTRNNGVKIIVISKRNGEIIEKPKISANGLAAAKMAKINNGGNNGGIE
jgi:hypothetical protein